MNYTQFDVDKILEELHEPCALPENVYGLLIINKARTLAAEVERMRVEIDRLRGDIDIAYSQGYNDGYLDSATEDCEE